MVDNHVRQKDILGVLIPHRDTGTQRHGEESHMTSEARIGVTELPVQEYQGFLAATSSQEEAVKESSLEPSKVATNTWVSEFWPLEL